MVHAQHRNGSMVSAYARIRYVFAIKADNMPEAFFELPEYKLTKIISWKI